MKTYVEPSARDAGNRAAQLVADRLGRAVKRRGTAAIAFSGGGTPQPMFETLTMSGLPWDRIDVFQVDERIAPDGDPDRNARALVEQLLNPAGVPAERVHLMPVTDRDLGAASERYAGAVAAVGPFDVVHLGIGDDGHTASWPPGDPVVDSPHDVDISGEYQGRRRMTLTPRVVNSARTRLFLVTERSKAKAVERWMSRDRALPVSRVHRTATIAVLDTDAARMLPR